MQFREQGKKIQCIRSTYDPAVKRSHQKVVATLNRWSDKLPSAGLDELTEAERQELAQWFEARQAAKSAQTNRFRASYAAQSLADITAAIRAAGAELTPEQAAAIWEGLGLVGKALRRAGHPRPKRAGAVQDAVTIDLLYQAEAGISAN